MLPLTPTTNLITKILSVLLSFRFVIKGAIGVLASSKNTKRIQFSFLPLLTSLGACHQILFSSYYLRVCKKSLDCISKGIR
jgi:hypothetical protein